MPSLSSVDYAATGGESCPVCGSAELDKAPASWPEKGEISVWVGCDACRHTWTESYRLAGYTELEQSPSPTGAV